jgi:starch synthase
MTGISDADVKRVKDPTFSNLTKFAIDYSDGIIKGSMKISADIEKHLKASNKPVLAFQDPENYVAGFNEFYNTILEETPALVE